MAQTPIADTDFKGKVRAYDPATSWDAAAGQTRTKTQQVRAEVIEVLERFGPLTDDELIARRDECREQYHHFTHSDPAIYRQASPQSVRTRRHELTVLNLIRWTGDKRPSAMGGPSNVWEIVV